MPLSVCVWWNFKLGDLYVYQCNLEAFLMFYLRNVSTSLSFFLSLSLSLLIFLSQCIYMHTVMQFLDFKGPPLGLLSNN